MIHLLISFFPALHLWLAVPCADNAASFLKALYIFAMNYAEPGGVDIINIYSVLLLGQIAWCFKWNDAVPQVVFPVSIQDSMELETSWFQSLLYKYVVNSHQMQKIPIILCPRLFYCSPSHEIPQEISTGVFNFSGIISHAFLTCSQIHY